MPRQNKTGRQQISMNLLLLLLLLPYQPSAGFTVGDALSACQQVRHPVDIRHQLRNNGRLSSTTSVSLSALQAIPDAVTVSEISAFLSSSITTASTSVSAGNGLLVSPEPIHTAFSVATFLPQPFWLLMIVLPNANITRKIMGGLGTYDRRVRLQSQSLMILSCLPPPFALA